MAAKTSGPRITRAEFYAALTIIWSYLVVILLVSLRTGARWSDYAVLAGTLFGSFFYSEKARRARRDEAR